MERLEVDLLVCKKNVAVEMVKRENSSGEDVAFLQHRLFRDAFDFAHVERLLVKFLDDHRIDLLLSIVVAFLLPVFKEINDPLLEILNIFVGGINLFC